MVDEVKAAEATSEDAGPIGAAEPGAPQAEAAPGPVVALNRIQEETLDAARRPRRASRLTLAVREMKMSPDSINEDQRTIDLDAATDEPIRRKEYFFGDGERVYDEALDMSPGAVRLERMNKGAALLDSHDYYGGTRAMIGAIVPGSARVRAGKLTARAKFSRSEAGERAFQDAKDGILRAVSVGYMIHKREIDDTVSPPMHRITDWEPHEVSAVAIPADRNAGFRSAQVARAPTGDEMPEAQAEAATAQSRAKEIDISIAEKIEAAMTAEQERRDTIVGTAHKLGLPVEFGDKHIREKTSIAEFNKLAIDEAAKREKEVGSTDGLNPFAAPIFFNRRTGGKEPAPGERAMREIACIGMARKFGISPFEAVNRSMGDDPVGRDLITRSLQASVASGGGLLIPMELSAELIELLRPRTVVRNATPSSRIISIPRGNLTMPRINTGATIGYVGEGASSAATQEAIGAVNFTARKAKAIVPISNDLIRFAQGSADAMVRDDMIRQLAVLEDANFLRGAGTVYTPKGMRNLAAAANILPSQSSFSVTTAIQDMTSLVNALESAFVPMAAPHWFFSQRTKNFFYDARDSVGGFLFRAEMNGGLFRGVPFSWTQSIPQNLGGGSNASEVYLVDMEEFIIADVPGLMIDASQEASYSPDGSTLNSAFDRDEMVIRVIAEHDCNVKHIASIGVLTGVLWS
jgi:HK97 family phage major capsid protein